MAHFGILMLIIYINYFKCYKFSHVKTKHIHTILRIIKYAVLSPIAKNKNDTLGKNSQATDFKNYLSVA